MKNLAISNSYHPLIFVQPDYSFQENIWNWNKIFKLDPHPAPNKQYQKSVKGLYYLVTKNMQEMYHTDQSTNL